MCLFRENAVAPWRFGIFNIDGGEPVKIFDLPTGNVDIRWTPDGRSLAYSRTSKGVSNVWSHPIDGGPDKQMTNFKNDQMFNFKWSPDGRSLVMARGNVMADIVLIHDFR